MNHLIVPVDLSPNSKVALRYAAHIAAAAKAGITIVFAYSLLEKAIRYTTKKGQVDKDPDKWIQNKIDKIHSKRPEIEVEYRIIKGDILDSIQRLIKITDADLVVMGCQGKDENPESYLGSIASAMIKTSRIPVLLVPPKYKFRGIHEIAIAVDNTYVNSSTALDTINTFRKIFNSQIQMLYLGTKTDTVDEEELSLTSLANEVIRIENEFYKESITAYLEQHFADLMVVIRRKSGFLENMLGPTRTFIEKFNVNVPMLVLIDEEV